ncbi:MAG: hypothetical protein KAY24_07455, partial [Candidatus Eisenbacteria sp.]|nr:hypothetical protein [Candidatus Eisenbacteria bacterium]
RTCCVFFREGGLTFTTGSLFRSMGSGTGAGAGCGSMWTESCYRTAVLIAACGGDQASNGY